MRQYTPERDCGTDQRVQLLVSANCELQMTRRDTFNFEIFGRIAGEFENFGCKVLEDCRDINSGLCGKLDNSTRLECVDEDVPFAPTRILF